MTVPFNLCFHSALEGYLLYRALVIVFEGREQRKFPLYIFGYGIPAVIAIATVIIAVIKADDDSSKCNDYCRSDACWLSDDYLWSFIGPLAGVLLFNIVILVLGLKTAYRVSASLNFNDWAVYS